MQKECWMYEMLNECAEHCSAQIAVVMVPFVVACVGSQMFRGRDFHTIIYTRKKSWTIL